MKIKNYERLKHHIYDKEVVCRLLEEFDSQEELGIRDWLEADGEEYTLGEAIADIEAGGEIPDYVDGEYVWVDGINSYLWSLFSGDSSSETEI